MSYSYSEIALEEVKKVGGTFPAVEFTMTTSQAKVDCIFGNHPLPSNFAENIPLTEMAIRKDVTISEVVAAFNSLKEEHIYTGDELTIFQEMIEKIRCFPGLFHLR